MTDDKTQWLRCPVALVLQCCAIFRLGLPQMSQAPHFNVAGSEVFGSARQACMQATGVGRDMQMSVLTTARYVREVGFEVQGIELRPETGKVLDCMIRDKEWATAELPGSLQCQLCCDLRFELPEVLKKNLFSVFLAADDRDESEISFGECRPQMAPLCWEFGRM